MTLRSYKNSYLTSKVNFDIEGENEFFHLMKIYQTFQSLINNATFQNHFWPPRSIKQIDSYKFSVLLPWMIVILVEYLASLILQ